MSLEPYPEIEVRCERCNLNKTYQSNDFTEEALKYLNGKSVGQFYFQFKCESCEDNPSLYAGEKLLFNQNDLHMCTHCDNPIPDPQLEIDPNKQQCIYCLEENEGQNNTPSLAPYLINSKPCPTCRTKRNRDPVNNAHRTGRTQVRLNAENNPYICCELYPVYPRKCSHVRGVRDDDEIEHREISTYQGLDIPLFRDEEISDDHELETQELSTEILEPKDVLEKIEIKFEQLKDLIRELRELVNRN